MYTIKNIIVVLFAILWAINLNAQESTSHKPSEPVDSSVFEYKVTPLIAANFNDSTHTKESKFIDFVDKVVSFFEPNADTIKKRTLSFFAIPEFSYSTEDGIGIGASVRTYINRYKSLTSQDRTIHESYIDLGFSITFKKHSSLYLQPEIYFFKDRLLIKGLLKLGHYPQNFWPTGPNSQDDQVESYTQKTSLFRFIAYHKIFENGYIGAGIHYYDYGVNDYDPNGLLAQGSISGSDGARISGVSAHYLYDTRDYNFVPTKGVYVQIDADFNGKFLGSKEDYTKYLIDLRYYFSIRPTQVFIINLFSQISVGDIPFQDMPRLSNGVHSRGYRSGRYIDKNVMAMQCEYRWYFGRFGLAGFVCASNVGNTPIAALQMNKLSAGGGFRIKPFKGQRMYFRADFGFSADGNMDMYLGIDELF